MTFNSNVAPKRRMRPAWPDWTCVCGTLNRGARAQCASCMRERVVPDRVLMRSGDEYRLPGVAEGGG